MDDDVALVATNESFPSRALEARRDRRLSSTGKPTTRCSSRPLVPLLARGRGGTVDAPRSYLTVTFGRRLRPMAPANSSSPRDQALRSARRLKNERIRFMTGSYESGGGFPPLPR